MDIALAIGLGWMPVLWAFCFIAGLAIAITILYGERPMRTDYNLFLRATEGVLKVAAADTSISEKLASYEGGGELFRVTRFHVDTSVERNCGGSNP